jgi:hypothetical protein
MTSNLRTEIELRQVYDKVVSFTRTTTGNAAETVITVSDYMEEANRISIVVETQALYVRFDGSTATDTDPGLSLFMPSGGTYTESDIKITGIISIINAANGANGRIRGTIWGR